MADTTRPTKKQHELLTYLSEFIAEHGYSPSYREIMSGCNYTSVSTVALHINNLIKRGHVVKRGKSARSLEVVGSSNDTLAPVSKIAHAEQLIGEIEKRLVALEKSAEQQVIDELFVLVGALKILGHHENAAVYVGRLQPYI